MDAASEEETPGQNPSQGQEAASDESMWELLSEEYMYCQPKRGDIRDAIVLAVNADEVVVSLGAKVNGIISVGEIERLDEETRSLIKPGAEIQVYVLNPDYHGEILVSARIMQARKDWRRAQECLEKGTLLEEEIVGYNRGGLLIRFGHIQGFVPVSQIVSIDRQAREQSNRLKELVGQRLPLKIIEVDPQRQRLILSERQARREWQKAQRRQLLAELQEGDVRHGVVSSLCGFGAFVDLGGADGLIHISEMSWKRVQRPEELLRPGQEVDVCVLSVDREKERIALSLKRLQPDPWSLVSEKYREGQLAEGVVTNILNFGIFVRLEPGIEGLVHISELSRQAIQEPGTAVQIGDRLLLRILQVDVPRHRLALSLKQVSDQDREQWAAQQRDQALLPGGVEPPQEQSEQPPEDQAQMPE